MDKRLVFLFLLLIPIISVLNIDIILKIAIIALLFSIISLRYFKEYIEDLELEMNFPIFLRDLSQYIKIGQPLPVAIKSLMNNSYGRKLDQYIRYIYLQMEYGIPFNKALLNLARKVRVKNVRETLIILSNLLARGGDIANLFESLSEIFYVSNSLKKERLANVRYLSFSYYGMFLLVILVIYMTYGFMKMIGIGNVAVLESYKQVSSVFLLLNAIFTGLVVGKVSEGRIFAGVIHSLILLVISVLFILIF